MTFNGVESDELYRWLDTLCDGELSSEELARFDACICRSPEARQIYIEYMDQHCTLPRLLGSPTPSLKAINGQNLPLERQASSHTDHRAIEKAKSSSGALWKNLLPDPATLDRYLERTPFVLFSTLLVLAGIFIGWRLHGQHGSESDSVVSENTTPAEYLGTLIETANCLWQQDELGPTPGSRLSSGRLELLEGTAEIRFDSGARVVLEGPATFMLETINTGFLSTGKLIAEVPKQAVGFTVRTPSGQFVDLGTEFGVVVEPSGDSELHVFRGEVVAHPIAEKEESSHSPELFRAGEAARMYRGSTTVRHVAMKKEIFLRVLSQRHDKEIITTVSTFSQAIGSAGLDLEGEFIYAVNVGGPTIQVGPLQFTDDEETPGITVIAPNHDPQFGLVPVYGLSTPTDKALATVMHSTRWGDGRDGVRCEMKVTAGTRYKLQLLISENILQRHRHFDILVDGQQVVDELDPLKVMGEGTSLPRSVGVVTSHIFTATKDRIVLNLNQGHPSEIRNPDPYFQAFTLEAIQAMEQ